MFDVSVVVRDEGKKIEAGGKDNLDRIMEFKLTRTKHVHNSICKEGGRQ